MPRITRFLALSLLAFLVAYPPGRASDDRVPQAASSNVQNLQFRGNVSWQISGNTVRFQAASIANIGTTSAGVYMTLLASSQPQRFGDNLSQTNVLARFFVGTLQPGSQFNNVDSGQVTYFRPAPGTYYMFATVDVLQGSSYVNSDLFPFPNTEAFGAACTQDATTHCLNGGRFSARVNWSVPSQGTSGVGTALPLVGGDTGYFWFFSSNAAELMVKIVDGRTVNGHFWFFYGALSNVQYTITLTDTVTGAIKTYQNPNGNLASVADVTAFADGSGGGPTPTPTPAPTSLAGTWSGTFSSGDPGSNCPNIFPLSGSGSFSQSGSNFSGSFSLPGNSSGAFIGTILGNQISGVFTSTMGGCNGSGNFTGSVSGNTLTASAPSITTAQQGCVFCQQIHVGLTRTGF